MTKFETVSVMLLGATLIALPILGWTMMMYGALQATGSMFATL